ncbi:MAG: hypothetical protein JO319_19455 [Acidobacteriaceae bacterium]|nr:hypothetical protein [Acidobacteriaceae bacterium]
MHFGPARLVAAAHRSGGAHPAGDDRRLFPAGIPIRPPGGWGRLTPAKPAIEVITDSAMDPGVITDSDPQPRRSPSASACEPYRDLIEVAVCRGRNAMAIWQDLVDEHGFQGGYQSVRRFVHNLRKVAPEPRVVIETAPGEEAQVDYGTGPMGARSAHGKVSAYAAVCLDTWI